MLTTPLLHVLIMKVKLIIYFINGIILSVVTLLNKKLCNKRPEFTFFFNFKNIGVT